MLTSELHMSVVKLIAEISAATVYAHGRELQQH